MHARIPLSLSKEWRIRRLARATSHGARFALYLSDTHDMLTKFFASWLVVLVVAPFTAPFSTCDLTSLFGNPQSQHTPVIPPSSVESANDAAVPVALFVSSAGREGPLPLSRVPLEESVARSSSATLIWSVASVGTTPEPNVLSTILRV